MKAEHLEILVEERSMEAFLRELLPRIIGDQATFNIYPSQGKADLLQNLPARLEGYAKWLPMGWRVVVVVDRDDDDCVLLKHKMEEAATKAGLLTRRAGRGSREWQVATRIAIEELEAWYFGDWEAVRTIYPRVSRTIPDQAIYRDPDGIKGGTWERLERVMQKAGYFESGLRKTDVGRSLGKHIEPARNRSRSFEVFRDVLIEAIQ